MTVLLDPVSLALSRFMYHPHKFPRVIGKEGYIDYITKPTPGLALPHMLLVEETFNLHTDGRDIFLGRHKFVDLSGQGFEVAMAWCQASNRTIHRWISAAQATSIVWTVRKPKRKQVA